MAKYKAYPEYKDSGVEWLGRIPEQWTVSKVKYLAPFQVGWTPPTKNDENFIGNNLWVTISDLRDKFISASAKFISNKAVKEASMNITPKGSLLYSFKLSVGAVSFAGCNLYTNEAIASFLENAHLPLSYLYYSLPIFIIENASTNIYGAKILNQELIKNSFLLAAECGESEKISVFLDHETAKIDNLLEKQQQLIELLKEKRQAVISHAVTKGLNPDAPMKDSGVEWSGDVPSHWLKTIIKHIAKINPLKTKIAPDIMKKECSFIPMENLKLNKIILDEHRVIRDVYNSYTYFEDKDILMAKVTPCFENKNIAIANNLLNGVGFGTTEIYVIRCNNKINNEYLFYRLQEDNFSAIAEGSMTGAGGLKRVPHEVVNSFQFYLPTIYEQNEIASFLNSATTKIDTLIQKQLQQIDLLKERRTALISAAVTGKIDLRDWTPPASSTESSLTAEETTA
ncbi:restriction endonuclease subunit S [Enterobacter vonholyi]|uniref:restriction endonuclease subunit S n=1 Tax=Enterobacter vonholyi TaxID=2797505 RepID=UPI002DB7B4FF|nr:restriction endonuclease subunit S [Enterobacter vonholyi]MEB5980091.1 restriction endonuclease subunit S [Enterobacter vonholyi]